jgi:hypothetical protein
MYRIGLFELGIFCALTTLGAWFLERVAFLPVWAAVPLSFLIALVLPILTLAVPMSICERLLERRKQKLRSRPKKISD